MKKTALITGVCGQDGSFLAEFLARKGYHVMGIARDLSQSDMTNILHKIEGLELIEGSITDAAFIRKVIKKSEPEEIYNLASQSLPSISWIKAPETIEANCIGAANIFEAVRQFSADTRVYQASSSEMFGENGHAKCDESSPFYPNNPYAASKVFSHNLATIYRQAYGLFVANGILFNHESERRSLRFVVPKVAYGAACAQLGVINSPDLNDDGKPIFKDEKLPMGNLNISRDWGFAGDYVEAMWLMLQKSEAEDFVIATGELHSIRDLCKVAFGYVGKNWQDYVTTNSDFVRPADSVQTRACNEKAKRALSWRPKLKFNELVSRMVDAQLNALEVKLGIRSG